MKKHITFFSSIAAAATFATLTTFTACSHSSDIPFDENFVSFNGGSYQLFNNSDSNYIISYFKSDSNGNTDLESLFLGYSTDGLHYSALHNNTYVYKIDASTGSGGQAIRDPYMNRIHDDDTSDSVSRFIMLATDWTWYGSSSYGKSEYGTTGSTNYWYGGGSPCLIMSEVHVDTSAKTVTFYKPGTTTEGATCVRMTDVAMHAWAPEIIIDYNEDGSAKPVYTRDGNNYYYGVIWSGDGTVPASSDRNNRTFVNYTNDFVHFTDPIVFFTDGNEIDATWQKVDGKFYLSYKGESSDLKGIKMAVSDSLQPGSFTVLNNSQQVTPAGFEGSWMVHVGDTWWMFADYFSAGGRSTGTGNFHAFTASSLAAAPSEWTQHANDGKYSFPTGIRHAFAFKVTAEELATFKAVYN